MTNLVLPTFSMDCRDWIVVRPEESGLADEVAGSPLLAVLSTVVLDGGFHEASCVLTACLMDDELPAVRRVTPDSVAAELIDVDEPDSCIRYLLPTPDGALALLAEFAIPGGYDDAMFARIEALMASFHWLS